MDTPLRLSRYSHFFTRNGGNFLYSALTNSFYKVSDDTMQLLRAIKKGTCVEDEESREGVKQLRAMRVLQSEQEDDLMLERMELVQRIQDYDRSQMGLTICPTLTCNLRCPYCFEQNKPAGMMDVKTADTIVKFIKGHKFAKTFSISWFGGEPLLGLGIMAHILEAVKSIDEVKFAGHGIITNATMLDSEAIKLFQQHPLGSMQVTLDGDRATHDTKRMTANGEGTFDRILANVDNFVKACPQTHVSFRVNVDNTNSAEYFDVAQMLRERYGEKSNVSVYPGILRANRGCENENFFTTKDHLAFSRRLVEHGDVSYSYPQALSKGCCATSINDYVIGPMGELYKCWEHVGKPDSIIGNIADEEQRNETLLNRYMLHGNCFDDLECRKCGMMPICSGGCPDRRVSNKFCNESNELCSLHHDENGEALERLLYDFYVSSNGEK